MNNNDLLDFDIIQKGICDTTEKKVPQKGTDRLRARPAQAQKYNFYANSRSKRFQFLVPSRGGGVSVEATSKISGWLPKRDIFCPMQLCF